MERSKFTEQQIAFALQQAESGTQVVEVCRKMGISTQQHGDAAIAIPHPCLGDLAGSAFSGAPARVGGNGREAESNIQLLGLVSAPAASDRMRWSRWNASNSRKALRKPSAGNSEFDQVREVPFVRKANDLALATSHLALLPGCRFTAAALTLPKFLDAITRKTKILRKLQGGTSWNFGRPFYSG